MVRWEPAAKERLQAAALELFSTRGFEQTTAAEIAQSVGLSERTFFRHFADKREVLFYGQELFVQVFLDAVEGAPRDAATPDVIARVLRAVSQFFPDDRRAASRVRQAVIEQNPALRERESHKLAGLGTVLAEALRSRGMDEPAATLAAESTTTVFTLAFAQWLRPGENRPLTEITSAVLGELQNLIAPSATSL
ncbi:TetR family transcriptional regulator [Microbacterium sp. STN6]|uniref:TetR family transcriptional regulator n=1 Tax=Microbacterium sp. STN6 TaxID=2995588 RepID=UPI002260FE58|nr:TetR family transcriptional regulator [Microbacterium sp. STN6]MCX7521921.1 TetR family transcriptional regulator [Microbacterium sp. STN6]